MPETDVHLRLLRFGNFEVDLRSGELRKAGVKMKLSGQPFQVLSILLERPGEVGPGTNCRANFGPTRLSMSTTT